MPYLSLYMKLARLDKPCGWILLAWPCYWGLFQAQKIAHVHLSQFIKSLILFTMGSIAMRSAGCIINDMADRDLDRKVLRTQNRPLASNALSMKKGFLLLLLFLMLGFFIFLTLSNQAKIISLLGAFFMIIYPFSKRITWFPQVVLGISFSIGIWVSWITLSPLVDTRCLFLFLASVLWTTAYDTIYAFQDIYDDKKVNNKSTAIYFEKNPKIFISFCYLLILCFLFCSSVSYIGILVFCLSCLFVLTSWDPKCSQSSMNLFKKHVYLSIWGCF